MTCRSCCVCNSCRRAPRPTGATCSAAWPGPVPATTSSPTCSACSACTRTSVERHQRHAVGPDYRANWGAFAGESAIDRLIRGLIAAAGQRLAADAGLDLDPLPLLFELAFFSRQDPITDPLVELLDERHGRAVVGDGGPDDTVPPRRRDRSAQLHRLAAARADRRRQGAGVPRRGRRVPSGARRVALPLPAPRPAARLPRHHDPTSSRRSRTGRRPSCARPSSSTSAPSRPRRAGG